MTCLQIWPTVKIEKEKLDIAEGKEKRIMKTKKGLVVFVLTITMILANTAIGSAAGAPFTDLPQSHWAHGNVNQMVDKGIIVGYPDETFKPDKKVIYGEFIKMAVVGITGQGLEMGSGGKHWAYNYYMRGIELGLYTGTQIPERNLDREIIRADMSLIAANAIEGTVTQGDTAIIEGYVLDIHKSTNRKTAVIKAYFLGVLAGYPDQTFRPEQGLTRAESAAVIDRIITPASRIQIDLAAMEATAPPSFPDGSTVAEKDLIPTIMKVDSLRLDTQYSSEIFAKYKNGGIYDMQQRGNDLVKISYHTGYRLDGTLAATDRQDAKVKFLLQHFLGSDWEKCYNDFKNMQKNYKIGADLVNIIKKYNGREVVMDAYNYNSGISIYR